MSHAEYLRKKLERMPKVLGPARYGDESLKTMAARYKASVRRPVVMPAADTCCRGLKPHWRTNSLPASGPFGRIGAGQQQERSSEFIAASAAGCAICRVGLPGAVTIPCCPADPVVELPLALQGKKTCCGYVGTPSQSSPLNCKCSSGPGYIRTWWANDMPANMIPYPVPITGCTRCGTIIPECECGDC
jgi:hypothetical protein